MKILKKKDFWECLKEMTNKERCMFIRFTCGLSRLPSNYRVTKKLKIVIEPTRTDLTLPRSATCFWTFYLPKYSSKSIMKERILTALHNCTDIDNDFNAHEEDD